MCLIGMGFITLISAVFGYIIRPVLLQKQLQTKSTGTIHTTKTSLQKKERAVVICPFSQGSDFMVESAEHLPLTPLEMYEDWVTDYLYNNNNNPNDCTSGGTDIKTKPLAARWLNMGMSGQDTPGILRAGLRRLKNTKYFLVEESHRMQYELLLKKKALDDPQRFSRVFVAQPESLFAQQECLNLFLEYLPRRYPDQYLYDKAKNTIHVHCIETTFPIAEYYNTRPLELCERIVQEDLCLMSPPKSHTDEMEGKESYRMAAAAVVFSFDGLPEKLGQPMEFLHAPVPGYERHIRKSMNLTFLKLKVEQPVWRNNWGIGPSGDMDKPLYGTEISLQERQISTVNEEVVRQRFF
jgi:Protein of unknown function (DUF3445)